MRERRLTKIEETTCDDEKAFVLRDFSPTAKNQWILNEKSNKIVFFQRFQMILRYLFLIIFYKH